LGDDKVGGKQIQEVQIEDSKSDNLAHTSTTGPRPFVGLFFRYGTNLYQNTTSLLYRKVID